MGKSVYKDHLEEIIKMKDNGKSNAEIVKILNKKYNRGANVNALKTFLKRHNSKKNEKKQKSIEKTVSENQKGVQKEDKQEKTGKKVPKKEKEQLPLFPEQPFKEATEKMNALTEEMEKNYSKQKEAAALQEQKMSETAALQEQKMSEAVASQEEALSNVRKMEAKYKDVTERHCILNETLHETIIMKREDNKKETTRYLIIGVFILALGLALAAGYHSSHYDDEISFHYMEIAVYVLAGAFVGFGLGVIKKKIMEKRQKRKSQ